MSVDRNALLPVISIGLGFVVRLVATVIHFISFNIRENRQYKHSKNIDCGTTRQNDCTYGLFIYGESSTILQIS